jgi:hypothetical protein
MQKTGRNVRRAIYSDGELRRLIEVHLVDGVLSIVHKVEEMPGRLNWSNSGSPTSSLSYGVKLQDDTPSAEFLETGCQARPTIFFSCIGKQRNRKN